MGTGKGQPAGRAGAAQVNGSTTYGAPYVPPPRTLPEDGPYGPDPHGRNGPRRAEERAGRRRRKAALIAVSVVVLALLLRLGIVALLDDGSDTSPSGTAYAVTLPRTLDGGRLTLVEDFSDDPGLTLGTRPEPGERADHALKPVAGRYESTPRAGGGARSGEGGEDKGASRPGGGDRLVLRGYNGYMTSPASTMHELLTALEAGDASAAAPETIDAPGSREPLTCEVLLRQQGRHIRDVPVCAWADRDSVGAVTDHGSSAADPSHHVDLDAFAGRVGALRDEVRSRAGGTGS